MLKEADKTSQAAPRRRKTGLRRIFRALVIFVGSLVTLLLLLGVFLATGGAKTAVELALPAAMNGYVTVDEASYFYFGPVGARNMSMVLDWHGEQETVVRAGSVRSWPRLLPLLAGRLEFGNTHINDIDLNLRILPSGLANIDRLFRLESMPPEPVINVIPPHYTEITDLRLSFPPFIYRPIQIDRITMSFYPISYERLQLVAFGQITGPLIGDGTVGMYLDIDDEEYIITYEGDYLDLDMSKIQKLPISPSIRLPRMLLPTGRVRFSGRMAGTGKGMNTFVLTAELAELNINSLQYPLSLLDATGKLTTDGKAFRINDLRGVVPIGETNATLHMSGLIYEDNTMVFDAALTNIRLSDKTLAFLPGLEQIKDLVSIAGECSLTSKIYYQPGWAIPRTWTDLEFRGQILPVDYPVPSYDVRARLRTLPRGAVIIDDFSVALGDGTDRSIITASGSFDAIRNSAQIFFTSAGINVTNDLLDRLPQIPRFVSKELRIEGKVSTAGEYVHTAEDDIFEMRAELTEFDVTMVRRPDAGAIGLGANILLAGNRLAIDDLAAEALTGRLEGNLDMNFASDNRSFYGDLVLTDIDLGLLPRDHLHDFTGIFTGTFHFEGAQPTLPALDLDGEVSLRQGHFAQLPLVISIINFLNLQLPGKVIFTDGRAKFRVKEETLHIDRVELYSDSLNVYAKGTVRFDGTIKLRAGVAYRKPFLKKVPIIGPIIMFFVGAVRSALTTVDVTGNVSDPTIRLVSMEYVKSPVKAVFSFFKEDQEEEQ